MSSNSEKAEGKVYIDKNNNLAIEGNISFSNVINVEKQGLNIIKVLPTIKIDLKKLNSSDSSGLALLSSWVRAAKQQNKTISICNIPKFLSDLSRVSGLDTILPT